MRINKYVALATGLSRRTADRLIERGAVSVNGTLPTAGQSVGPDDIVTMGGKPLVTTQTTTILFHKPVGYVVSRDGQGNQTIYDILPRTYHELKPVGRLDKNSSGLLVLTNDGQLAQQLTHPSFGKIKRYEIALDKPLQPLHHQMIVDFGVLLDDGPSQLQLERMYDGDSHAWFVQMTEGRNRQIRRTFEALGYRVKRLHRTAFGSYTLDGITVGNIREI